MALYDGKPVVAFEVARSRGASEVEVGDGVEAALKELRAAHPDLVIRETRRCASIIRRLLDFARDKPPQKADAQVTKIRVFPTERLHSSKINQQLRVEAEYSDGHRRDVALVSQQFPTHAAMAGGVGTVRLTGTARASDEP